MRFFSVDVETANEELSSICQIGIAEFGEGGLVDTFVSYINPEADFSSMNELVHGITYDMVAGAPKMAEIFPVVGKLLAGKIVAHHMPFDRTALGRAADALGVPPVSDIMMR
jgi:DNA polymerase-3 subunit epsilon